MSYTIEQLRQFEAVPEEKREEFRRKRLELRTIDSCFYDVQKARIEIGNRICASYYTQMGVKPGTKKADTLSAEELKILKNFEDEYNLITDALVDNRSGKVAKIIASHQVADNSGNLVQLSKIRSYSDFALIAHYIHHKEDEIALKKALEMKLPEYPIYTEFLSNIRGVGPLMAGVIISYFDPYVAKYSSSFIKYAGLDPVVTLDEEGNLKVHGRTNHEEDLILRDYVSKKTGKVEQKKSTTYNPFVKTKLVGVLADCFIKAKSDYATCFYDRMHRLNNNVETADLPYGRKVKIANRYMINQFLKDLFVAYRRTEGLPVPLSYEEEFLGKAPHGVIPYKEWMENHPEDTPAAKKAAREAAEAAKKEEKSDKFREAEAIIEEELDLLNSASDDEE